MKILITESQFVNTFIKRRFHRIDELVTEKMKYYPPCDYIPFDLWDDYYEDVVSGVMYEIVSDAGIEWDVPSMKKIEEIFGTLNDPIKKIFHDKIREYYDKFLDEGCEEEDF
jgi:hypothetical protein